MTLRVLMAGSWDPGFHRNRAILRFLRKGGCEVEECRVELWGTEREGLVDGKKLSLLLRALVAYPLLIWRFFRTSRPDLVLVPYPGHCDVPVLALLCRLRGLPLVFDIFISLHDTMVSDRKVLKPGSLLAWVVRTVDWFACRMADLVLADTPAHAAYFAELSGRDEDRFEVVWVGADPEHFHPLSGVQPESGRVLFYGTFIPLHGVETIVRAAGLLRDDGVRFRLVGTGQEAPAADRLLAELEPGNVERIDRVPLDLLHREIARAQLCLGIFGCSDKADRVVPNKVFQCLAVGRPVVTGDTSAIRSAFDTDEISTVPVGDPGALAERIRVLLADDVGREKLARAGKGRFDRDYSDKSLAALLVDHLRDVVS